MKKLALITGITGQDGSYLSEFLLKKDCKEVCISSDYNHRLEKRQKGGKRARCIDLT